MKLVALFTLLPVFSTSTFALMESETTTPGVHGPLGGVNILKRGCTYDTPCRGYGWRPGEHCGDGNFGCVKGHVYQIGSETNVCDYGVQTSCGQCGKLSC